MTMTCNATIVTGTGRAGTSFLIGLLSLVRLPTGFNPTVVRNHLFGNEAHAGLEHDPELHGRLLQCNAHRSIFKSPRLFSNTYWMDAANLGFVIVPIRKSEDAAASREHQSLSSKKKRTRGGLIRGGWTMKNIHNMSDQMTANDHTTATFFWKLSALEQPHLILLEYFFLDKIIYY